LQRRPVLPTNAQQPPSRFHTSLRTVTGTYRLPEGDSAADNPARSAAWNRRTFGKCNNPNWHGHNYSLEVSIVGQPDPATGYVLDLNELKALIHREITEPCDHKNLNIDVPFLKGVIPSTENLVIAFWQRLDPCIKNGRLYRLRLSETDRNSAEYCGPAGPQPM
jgi:6-pyruvoyltetrahydropterin/6-carboxytetrahydropterin synthase